MKDAIAAEAAIGEGLRIVLESIRRRFDTAVVHREQLILLHERELHLRPRALDRPRLHIPRHPQPLAVSPIPHLVQLADGDVVALAILHPGISKVAEQEKNHDRSRAEFEIRFALAGHREPPAGAICLHSSLYPTAGPESRFSDTLHANKNFV